MKHLLTLLFVCAFLGASSQSKTKLWTAQERQACYDMIYADLAQEGGLSKEDMQAVAGCAAEQITSENEPANLEEMAEYERRNFYGVIVGHCKNEALVHEEEPKKTSLILKNNTSAKMSVAYAMYDDNAKCWVSHGWEIVEANQTISVGLGEYKGKLFICGRQLSTAADWLPGSTKVTEKIWGDAVSFCVNLNKSKFTVYSADKNAGDKRLFSGIDVKQGDNEWIFNPK